MRKEYKLDAYQSKIEQITEYYKFHTDHPNAAGYSHSLQRILNEHYDKEKQIAYKQIKRILKDENNISITTQKSSEVVSIEEGEDKSKWSNILDGNILIDDSN